MKQVHPISLAHFEQLLGEYGIYQHAKLLEPRLSEGYCVDDNARAVLVLLHLLPHADQSDVPFIERALSRCWKFLVDAQRPDGSMYNFRTATGVWLTHDVSGDMYARVLRACVAVMIHDADTVRAQQAHDLMHIIIGQADALFVAPRACAEVLIALHELSLHVALSADSTSVAQMCATRLVAVWNHHASSAWPWFEDAMTYANGILPHGILAALQLLQNSEVEQILRRSASFLIETTIRDGMFTPIGNSSWYHRDGRPSKYDQQPIEAAVMLDFLVDLRQWDSESISVQHIALPYDWFFGNNTATLAMANQATGTCYDGLHEDSANENCGAESLLAYLWAEVRMQEYSMLAR